MSQKSKQMGGSRRLAILTVPFFIVTDRAAGCQLIARIQIDTNCTCRGIEIHSRMIEDGRGTGRIALPAEVLPKRGWIRLAAVSLREFVGSGA